MKVRDIIKRIEEDGWNLVRDNGSHKIYKKHGNPNEIVVSGHGREEVSPGVLSDIRRSRVYH